MDEQQAKLVAILEGKGGRMTYREFYGEVEPIDRRDLYRTLKYAESNGKLHQMVTAQKDGIKPVHEVILGKREVQDGDSI